MAIGTLIERRFRLARLAGRGGMGDVYEAVDVVTGATVALKLLKRRVGTDLERFEREVRLLASFESPRIVRHIAHGADAQNGPYLAMEWLVGEDLATRLARSRLTASESWSIARGIAEALTHLHGRGVVHRDLKPGNVFLANSDAKQVKLLDFGIAHVDATHRMTMTGAVVGTAGYMAPEQIRGVTPIDARADVFAAGCIFMECLTGEPPYQGGQILALLTKILFDDPPRLGERCPSAPDALVALLDRMLCRDPAGRLASGQALLDAMDPIPEPPNEVLERAAPAPPLGAPHGQRTTRARRTPHRAAPVASDGGPDDELDADARHHGAAIERLPDGSVVMMLWSTTVATDLVARAAGWALGLADRLPGRAIAMAIGHSQVSDRLPLGAAV